MKGSIGGNSMPVAASGSTSQPSCTEAAPLLRRRIPTNSKLLAALLLVGLITGCQPEQDPDALYQEARHSIDSGDLNAAIIQLKVILQESPGHLPSRIQIGRLYQTIGNPLAAEKELEYALNHGGDKDAILPALLSVYVNLGRAEKASELPVDGLTPENLGIAYAFQSQAQLMLGNEDKAQTLLDKANELSGESPEVKTTSAAFSLVNDREQAKQLLREVVEQDPAYAPAWSRLAVIHDVNEDPDSAEEAYSEAIKLNGGVVDYLRRASLRLRNGKLDEAQADINLARKMAPNYYEVDFLQGQIFMAQNRLEDSQNSFLQTYSKKADFTPGLYFLALNSYLLKQYDTALDLAETYYQEGEQNLPGRLLLAQVLLRQGNFLKPVKLLQSSIEEEPENLQVIATLADAYHGSGQFDKELPLLNKLTTLQGDSEFLQYRRIVAQLRSGQAQEGLAQAQSALASKPDNWPVVQALVQYHSVARSFDKALEAARSFAQNNPDSAQAFNLLGVSQLQAGQTAEAKASFAKAHSLEPSNIKILHNMALVALTEKDISSAKSYYQKALKTDATDLATLLKLAALEREDDKKAFVSHLQTAITHHPEALHPRYLLARYYLENRETEKVLRTLGDYNVYETYNREIALLQAEYYFYTGDSKEAERLCDLTIRNNADDIDALFLKSQLLRLRKEDAAAGKLISRILKLQPDYLLANIDYIDDLTRRKDFSGAEQHAERMLGKYPGNPQLLMKLGIAQRALGKSSEARDNLEQAYKNAPGAVTLAPYASLLFETEPKEALSLLEGRISKHPDEVPSRSLLAGLYLKEGRETAAAKQYESILQTAPNNLLALNNLAWLYRQDKPETALDYSRKATRLQAGSPPLLDTFAVVLMHNEYYDRALEAINEATRNSTPGQGDPTYFFHKAQILDAMGKKDESKLILNALLDSETDFPEKAEAQDMLKRL
ncbi:XrtA/PEP-CTERM system TPR-repeat protein PrsT [Pseudomaricurvus sp. HS19]|uniref:XrtA/PEP-CTERM system TPR-repeat protein PrsT n=1 Tax=Pseudomaricurvus sp. HS19 TaxID=2692626 RepID=UPI001371546E|nr:PEP-CTERM system TPR-repeat protein PrsT [Pseudomaricurvus sp. HS19]